MLELSFCTDFFFQYVYSVKVCYAEFNETRSEEPVTKQENNRNDDWKAKNKTQKHVNEIKITTATTTLTATEQ